MDQNIRLRKQFVEDLDDIVEALITSCNLKYHPTGKHKADPLIRWLDYVLRVVEPRPREVFFSSRFNTFFKPEIQSSLEKIVVFFKHGLDVNPYQSSNLKRFNDVYAKKKHHKTDMLWADWGIHHFHLTERPIKPTRYFSDRADWLVFCYVTYDRVYFLDVRKHDEANLFADRKLLELLFTEWPDLSMFFELKGILPALNSIPNAEEVQQLRHAGITPAFSIGTKAYMGPGMGITLSGTSTKVSHYAARMNNCICRLADYVCDENGFYKQNAYNKGISEPKFVIRLSQKGLALCEEKEPAYYLFPRRSENGKEDVFEDLHHIVIPDWLIESWQNN